MTSCKAASELSCGLQRLGTDLEKQFGAVSQNLSSDAQGVQVNHRASFLSARQGGLPSDPCCLHAGAEPLHQNVRTFIAGLSQNSFGSGGVIAKILAQQPFSRAGDLLSAFPQQVVADHRPGLPLGLAARAPVLARDDLEQDIAVAPFTERAPNPPRRPPQAPHLGRTRLGKQGIDRLL